MELYEKYRPKDWGEVLGQDKAIARIQGRLTRCGAGGQAFWITGQSGTGKTTIARLIAKALAGARVHEYRCADELTASEVDTLDWEYKVARGDLCLWKHAVIVNEAHGLSGRQVRTLLGLLEPIPASFVWVFTTTWDGQNWLEDAQIDASALLSRCAGGEPIRLTNQGLAPIIARRAREVALAENLDGQPEAAYLKLAQKHKNNWRGVLEAIQDGAMLQGGAA